MPENQRRVFKSSVSVLCVALACACSSPLSSTDETTADIALREVDGGPSFYAKFDRGLPTDPDFFPIGVWQESVVDDTWWPTDKETGIDVYVEPVPGTQFDRIARNGMYSIASWASPDDPVSGYFTTDEADMSAGAGDSKATGNVPGEGPICIPETSKCGYTVMKEKVDEIPSNRMIYTNYGKGVLFWQTDEQASRFVNDYQNVVSADAYWFTDPNICSATEGGSLLGYSDTIPEPSCRLASNYGRTVDRVRSLVEPAGSKPVWAFVEVGHPFADDNAPEISASKVRAAVWSSIIHGARGVVYFNHSFGGDCQSQHVLRDCGDEFRGDVAALNDEIHSLAPVLNAPFVDGLLSPSDGVDAAAKLYDGRFYIIAGLQQPGGATSDIEILCGGATVANVVGENRTVTISDGHLVDDFADAESVHIYEVTNGDTCGLS